MIGSTGPRLYFALPWVCALVLAAPPTAVAADKDVIELQREVAALSEQVRNLQTTLSLLQSTVDQKLGAQGSLLQQALDGVNQIRTDNAVALKSMAAQLSQEEQKVAVPIASLNAKIDQMIASFSSAQDNIGDMNSRLGKLEQQIIDLTNVVKVMQAGPQPPAQQAAGGPPPGVTAEGLFQDATRDQLSGKSEIALDEYTNYLKYFPATDAAAKAQFQIGLIMLQQGNADHAIQAFDAVVAQYPKSPSAPDAMYKKAEALKKEGQRGEANQVLRDLIKQYADSDAAARAKTDLTPARSPKK